MDEFEWIESISRFQAPGGRGGLIMGIGDDCAVFEGPAGRWLLFASDMLAAGVHFPEGEEADLADVGWKAASVNMSDVAAMGGRPLFAAVSVAVPGNMEPRRLWPLYEGMRLAFEAEGAGIIGGDTVRAAGGLTVNVAIIGEVEKDGAVLRRGAAAGDALWVTGPLGDAYAGLRLLQKPELEVAPQLRRRALEAQLRPRARVGLGRALRTAARAMLDISDGLAGDLTHLCRASGVGARVEAESIPVGAACEAAAAACGEDALQWALGGGEDFELLFAAAADWEPPIDLAGSLRRIGVLTPAGEGIRLVRDGREEPWPQGGWKHF